jgi:hypothetical protein
VTGEGPQAYKSGWVGGLIVVNGSTVCGAVDSREVSAAVAGVGRTTHVWLRHNPSPFVFVGTWNEWGDAHDLASRYAADLDRARRL